MEDIRVIKTKENLYEAFFEVLNFETYESMTVNQLCQYARCSRSTFYVHYMDKDDLLADILDAYLARYAPYAEKRFRQGTDFAQLIGDLLEDLVLPERDRIQQLLKIDHQGRGMVHRLEEFCQALFREHYPDQPDILSVLYGACVVKILQAILAGELDRAHIKILEQLKQSLLAINMN